MMKLNELKPTKGSRPKAWRKGRGHGSGNGKTAGRGHKGQNARSGGGVRPQFEGGQMPLYRRVPKRGSTSAFKTTSEINVEDLNKFEEVVVDVVTVHDSGVLTIPKVNDLSDPAAGTNKALTARPLST